jgi:MFS family permease
VQTRSRRVNAYAIYVAAALCMVGFFNYADRMVLAVLLQPIKSELHFSDAQLGMLTGFAFAVFYATLGVPLARLADRYSRVLILSIAMTVWSTMTVLCGMAQSFSQLLLARIGVGTGEAGSIPTSHSLLGDYFPKERRAFIVGVFQASGSLGMMCGLMIGGMIAERAGWRWALMLIGAPGVLVAILVWLTVREPVRGSLEPELVAPQIAPRWREAIGTLLRRPTYVQLVIAWSLGVFTVSGIQQWVPSFFIRSHHLSIAQVGHTYGLNVGLGGFLGTIAGAFLASKMVARDRRWELWIPALSFGVCAPLYAIMFLVPSSQVSMGIVFVVAAFASLGQGPGLACIQSVAEPHLRATAISIVLFSASLIGQGGGPFVVGALSDWLALRYGDQSLRIALIASTPIILWASIHFALASRTLRRDLVS